ncbi:MAG: hypothetical protein WCX73_03925 [Candidatus Pacearchaeota archaeon]|jgi:hypothetical protein
MKYKKEFLMFAIPSVFLIISVPFIIYGMIPSTLQEKMYSINLRIEPVNGSLSYITFNRANFYYDFTLNKGYFKFASLNEIKTLALDLPSEIINQSLKVYTVETCLNNTYSYCNPIEIDVGKEIRTMDSYEGYPLEGPKKDSIIWLIFDEFDISKDYLISFELKDFEPNGKIYFYRPSNPSVILHPDNNGNLMFNLGRDYECKNCFYDEYNLKEDYWSSSQVLRLSIPKENQSTDPKKDLTTSSFRISTVPTTDIQNKNLFLSIGISISSSMIAIIVTLILELIINKKKK